MDRKEIRKMDFTTARIRGAGMIAQSNRNMLSADFFSLLAAIRNQLSKTGKF